MSHNITGCAISGAFSPITNEDLIRRIGLAITALTRSDNPELARTTALQALLSATSEDRLDLN